MSTAFATLENAKQQEIFLTTTKLNAPHTKIVLAKRIPVIVLVFTESVERKDGSVIKKRTVQNLTNAKRGNVDVQGWSVRANVLQLMIVSKIRQVAHKI